MLLIQLTGLCGAGEKTLAFAVKERLRQEGYRMEVIDGEACRSAERLFNFICSE